MPNPTLTDSLAARGIVPPASRPTVTPATGDKVSIFDASNADAASVMLISALATLLNTSPALTGTPTAPTAAGGTNTTQIATTAFVKAALDSLVAAAPGALDTLDELAAALGDDANFAATMTTALAGKQPLAANLTDLAGQASTAFGRALLNLADAAALRASVGDPWPARVAGNHYVLDPFVGPSTGANIGTSRTRCNLVRVSKAITIDRLGCNITTSSAAGNLRLALYNHDFTNARPGTLVAGTGNIATDSATRVVGSLVDSAGNAVTSVTLQPGLYWIALRVDNATVAVSGYAASAPYAAFVGNSTVANIMGSSSNANYYAEYTTGYSFAGNFTDLSSTAPDVTGFSNNNCWPICRAA